MRIFYTITLLLSGLCLAATTKAQSTRLWYITQEGGTPDLYDTNVVYISTFAKFKPDFERICGIATNYNATTLQWEATCTGRPFTIADTGKILVVKNARSYTAYRKNPFTLNAIITAVEGNTAIITSIDRYGTNNSFAGVIKAVTAECGFVATDNFEVMQQAIDSCAARGKHTLKMNYTGTAYLVPQRSSRIMPKSKQKSLLINNRLEIRGYDSSQSKMKWGLEEISRVDETTMPFYAAFTVQGCTFSLKKMTLLSPDRGSTNTDHQNLECITGNADSEAAKTGQNIFVDSSAIVSEDGTGFEGWGRSVYMNGSITLNATDTAIQSITNSFISAQAGPAYFSHKPYDSRYPQLPLIPSDTLNRLQRVYNSKIIGGARYCHKASGVTISIGSNIVVVHDPNFSFLNNTDYEFGGNFRYPIIFIAKEDYIPFTQPTINNIYKVQILEVLNDSTAIMDTTTGGLPWFPPTGTGPAWATTNATLYTLRDGGGGYAAFHSLYISGNVGGDNLGSTFIPLRSSRNVQNTCTNPTCVNPPCPQICNSCLVKDSGNQGLFYSWPTYQAAAELKTIIQGVGNGFVISSPADYSFPAPQKVW
jgi:hypothetical protein